MKSIIIFSIGEDDLEIRQLHDSNHSMVTQVGKHLVLVDFDNFHDCSFLDKEEFLALCPCVLDGVTEDLPLLEIVQVLLVYLDIDRCLCARIVAVIKEEVIILVLVINTLTKQLVYLLEVGQCINIGDLVLLGIIVYLVVVQLVIISHSAFDRVFALYQQVCQHIALFPLLHHFDSYDLYTSH